MKKYNFKCAECGGSKLSKKAWVDMNTNEYMSDIDDNEVWCDDCENHVDFCEDHVDFIDKTEPEKVIKLYTVKLERPLSIRTIEIEASSEEEAIDMAFDMYHEDKILLFDNVDFEVIDVNDINY